MVDPVLDWWRRGNVVPLFPIEELIPDFDPTDPILDLVDQGFYDDVDDWDYHDSMSRHPSNHRP